MKKISHVFLTGSVVLFFMIFGANKSINSQSSNQLFVEKKEVATISKSPDELILLLLDQNLENRELAFRSLKDLGSNIAVPSLIKALRDKDWQVQVVAAYTLGRFGSDAQSAIPALSQAIEEENADIRFVAARALGEIGSESVVPALIEALQDKDENVRVSAAEALKKIGPTAEAAIPELTNALWDGNWYVRNRAAETIAQLGWDAIDLPSLMEPWRSDNPPSSGAIVSLMIAIQPSVINNLEKIPDFFIKSLQDEDPSVRQSATVALDKFNGTSVGYLQHNEAINGLIRSSKDEDSRVRQSAVKALGGYKDYPISSFDEYKDSLELVNIVVSALIEALKDEDADVRQSAAKSLSIIYDLPPKESSAVVSALIEALKDEDPNVRQSAAQSLDLPYDFPPKEASAVVSALIEALKDEDAGVRQSAVESLNIDDLSPNEPVISALIEALKDQDESVRQSAGLKLWYWDNSRIWSWDNNRFWFRTDNNEILPSTLSKIIQQKDLDNEIRRSAVRFISSQYMSNDSAILQVLTQALEDQDIGVRQNAAIVLWKNKQLNTQDALDILGEGLLSEDPLIQLDAVVGLATVGTEAKPVISSLIPFLQEEIEALRYSAALAITDITPRKECVPILSEMLDKETDLAIRDNVRFALDRINSKEAFSVHVKSWEFEDIERRYVTTCVNGRYIPYVFRKSPDSYLYLLLIKALENENIRSSIVMPPYSPYYSYEEEGPLIDFNLVNIVIPGLIRVLENKYEGNPALKEIFEFKGRDIRRSAAYALGGIRHLSGSGKLVLIDIGNRQKIVNALTVVVQNQQEDIDIRWMAATSLQNLGINQDSFFTEQDLINPKTVKCSFPYSQLPHVLGLQFDTYSARCYHADESGCGDGLAEIYSELRRRLSRSKTVKK